MLGDTAEQARLRLPQTRIAQVLGIAHQGRPQSRANHRCGISLVVNAEIVTLIAALIAASAAMATLVVNTVTATRRERRDTHRKAVEIELSDLADALHQVVATSYSQHRFLADGKIDSAKNWHDRGIVSKSNLDRLRPRVRYSIPGIDQGLRNLARLPSWIANHKGRDTGALLLDRADTLATALHDAIEQSWRTGRAPAHGKRKKIDDLVASFRELGPASLHDQSAAEEPVDGSIEHSALTAAPCHPAEAGDKATSIPLTPR
jgi:hypothetical protein